MSVLNFIFWFKTYLICDAFFFFWNCFKSSAFFFKTYFLLDLFLKNFYFWSKYLSLIILRNVEKQATIKILYIQLKPVDLKGFFPSQHLPSITFWGFSFNTIPTVLLTHTQTGKCPIRNSCVYREVFIKKNISLKTN